MADYKSQVPGQQDGRFLEVDPEVFRNSRFVKWDAHTMLPSLDLKARVAARDTFFTLDMLKAQEEKTKPLLVNWENPCVWDKYIGLK